MTTVQLIAGLENPGPEYGQTRRSAGTLFVERLAHVQGVSFIVDRKYFDLVGKFSHQGKDVRLLVPTTYMGRNGQSVTALTGFFRITSDAVLMARDELDMPPGVAKFKTGGGHGRHNGLRNVTAQLGSQNFLHHLWLGVGHSGHNSLISGYVFGRAPRNEQELLDTSTDSTLSVLPEMLARDWTWAMQKLHS